VATVEVWIATNESSVWWRGKLVVVTMVLMRVGRVTMRVWEATKSLPSLSYSSGAFIPLVTHHANTSIATNTHYSHVHHT
jgi:hypothetical protein